MKKISTKITVAMIGCSCVAILFLGGICITRSRDMIQGSSEDKLLWMAGKYAAQFSNQFNMVANNVAEIEVYFRDTFDVRQLRSDPEYLARYEDELAKYLFNFAVKRSDSRAAWCYFNPELSEEPHDVYFVDGDGDGVPDRQNYIPFSYYDETPTPSDDKQWWYGPIETKKGFWTNPYEWTLKNGETIKVVSYAQPVFIDGQFIAVIGSYYHFDAVLEEIAGIKVYDTGYATLYNEKLDIIVHPYYSAGTRFTSDNLQTVQGGKYAALSSDIISNNSGIVTYSVQGTDQLMAYGKLDNGWVLGIHPVQSEMFAGVNLLTLQIVAAIALWIVVSIFISFMVGARITRPLRRVVQCAKEIGTGNLDVKVEVDTNDEIKTVADSLNEMVANINKLQGRLSSLAYYDALTGIPNMNLFKMRVREVLESSNELHAYVILDVNNFKVINDIFGYIYGDKLLRHIAETIAREFCDNEAAARYTGDIFHIFCRFSSRDELEDRLERLAEKISAFTADSADGYRFSVNFGVYVAENTNLLVEMMGDYAALAVRKIKNNYSTSVYFYNDDIRNRILQEKEIENSMQDGIDNESFKVYIQPKYSLETMGIDGGEALVRWVHPQKGFLPPDTFISVFEKNGFITKLDMYMLDKVCGLLRRWLDSGIEPVVISVNQSRLHLNNPDYLNTLVKILESHNIGPEWIELEITESVFFEDTELMISIINSLHELGFKISMDDFGSGYSSLNMLNSISVDVLKIERKFFNATSNNLRGRKIVNNIISMASDLGIVVVAEGVETREQVEFLQETGCALVQGYYFAKPMPAEEFEAKLADNVTNQ